MSQSRNLAPLQEASIERLLLIRSSTRSSCNVQVHWMKGESVFHRVQLNRQGFQGRDELNRRGNSKSQFPSSARLEPGSHPNIQSQRRSGPSASFLKTSRCREALGNEHGGATENARLAELDNEMQLEQIHGTLKPDYLSQFEYISRETERCSSGYR